MAKLQRVILKGFKSIKEMDIELRSLNILIGANGAGKSNLVSFFKMLNEMMGMRLQQYIAMTGRAQSILHFGSKVTTQMEAQLEFGMDNGVDTYTMCLSYAAGDTLIFTNENLSFLKTGFKNPQILSLGVGHQETNIVQRAIDGEKTFQVVKNLIVNCPVYHFHDTSLTARVRQYCYIGDNRWLMPDAANLAAFLLRLSKENEGVVYRRIVGTIRLIAPFFDNFDLKTTSPGKADIILNWRSKDSDQVFGPHQLSDGTLRAICLVALLMQPEDDLPELIVVDEPELGLHPYALNMIAALFKKASSHTQILVSTQSSAFLDNFEPEDVIVVNRDGKESKFERPDAAKLESWLDEYSLGEVWEKNIIGGGPH